MLESLRLEDAPCFGPGPTDIGPLGKVSFFFGANGAGKTTISESLRATGRSPRAIPIWAPGTTQLTPRVYNRAYVEETVASGASLPGVFVLGQGSAEAKAEIDELERSGGPIAIAEDVLRGLRIQLGQMSPREGVLGAIADTDHSLSEAAWDSRDRFPPALRPTFDGFNNSKARLLDKVLAVAGKHADSDLDEQHLLDQAAGTFDPDATGLAPLPTVTALDADALEGHELLLTPIVGSGDVSLARLIDTLGNIDWVAEGRRHLDSSGGLCPFCQQTAPVDLVKQLAEYFDDTYVGQVDRLRAFARRYRDEVSRLRSVLASIDTQAVVQLPSETFALSLAQLEAVLNENETRLESKLTRPASAERLLSFTEPVEAVNDLLRAANAQIDEHNERVRNRATARAALVERCWRYFVRGTLSTQITAYEAAREPLLARRRGLEQSIAKSTTILREAQERVSELRAQLRSSQTVVDAINGMLASVGFTSFTLAQSGDDAGGYQLIRDGGSPAATTLSEGERTFITFLYFVHQLRHVSVDASTDTNLLVVIDDPISSLDSDVLFVVSSLTRRIIQSTHKPEQRVKQVLVLTHNTQFHKEITYVRNGEKTAGTAFFTVRKVHGGHSCVAKSPTNPVTSAYRALWDEVRRAAADPTQQAVGLENVLRRIVENYFTTVGIGDDALVDAFPLDQQIACRSLFAWMNDGSHTIMDDLHYAPSGLSTQTHLHVFREVFDRAGHGSHYAMMMKGVISAPTPPTGSARAPIEDPSTAPEGEVIEMPA